MRMLIPNQLWIGNARDARNPRSLSDGGIQAVLDLAIEEPPVQSLRDMISIRIPLLDGEGNSLEKLQVVLRTASEILRLAIPTLVACSGGMSRSPVIAAAALSLENQSGLDERLNWIASGGPCDVNPLLLRDVRRALTTLLNPGP